MCTRPEKKRSQYSFYQCERGVVGSVGGDGTVACGRAAGWLPRAESTPTAESFTTVACTIRRSPIAWTTHVLAFGINCIQCFISNRKQDPFRRISNPRQKRTHCKHAKQNVNYCRSVLGFDRFISTRLLT